MPTKKQLDGVVASLEKQFSFKANSTGFSTEKVAKSYDNIIRMQHLLATPEQKTGIRQVEGALKKVYAQRAVLGEAQEVAYFYLSAMMQGIKIPEGTVSSEALFTKMERRAKGRIRKRDIQDAALQIIKELRESEKERQH